MISIYLFINLAYSLVSFHTKHKEINVNVLISPEYIEMYKAAHSSLGTSLIATALQLETAFNNSIRAKTNGYGISFKINMPIDNPITLKSNSSICEGSVGSILDLLNEVNRNDNTHHYIVLLPCSAELYNEFFNSVGVDVPIIDYSTNIECSKRIAIFYEPTNIRLLSSFGNALLKTINAPSSDYVSITESTHGDEGLKASVALNDDTVYSILTNKCFLNS